MLILCSQSPRRQAILTDLGLEFQVVPSGISEDQLENEFPLEYLERVARAKANTTFQTDHNLIVSADTIVVYQNTILHKPKNLDEAFEILSRLNGKTHRVHSGLCLLKGDWEVFCYETTEVVFRSWSDPEIWDYIHKSKPTDKAGSYGIQDERSPVERWNGSYSNVLGFPLRSFLSHRERWEEFWRGNLRP